MSQIIDALKNLYAIDAELIKLKAKLGAMPKEIKRQQQIIDAAKADKSEVEIALRERASTIDEINLDVQTAENEIEELEGKLGAIKNNKEYKILTERIKDLKQSINENETRELTFMEELDTMKKTRAERQAVLEAAEAALEALKAENESDTDTIRSKQQEFATKRKTATAAVEALSADALSTYMQSLRRGKGQALAEMTEDGTCQGCFRQASPNLRNIVHQGASLEQCLCVGCGRILISSPQTGTPTGD